ncbi:MAG: hypothetical protein IJI25_05010 [Eubacterium sp.]|nr:hypothetical protein [Eubacterium sp.]
MIKRLYKEAVNEGVFQEAYSLAGFEDKENVEELKTTLEEYGKKLDRMPNRNLSAEKYADELVDALYGDAQDLLGVEMIHSLGGEEKAMGMTYGEFYAYNKAAQVWLDFLLTKGVSDDKTEDEWEAVYLEAEDLLWEEFKRRMALKRA